MLNALAGIWSSYFVIGFLFSPLLVPALQQTIILSVFFLSPLYSDIDYT